MVGASNPENGIHFSLMGAFPVERTAIFKQAAETLEIPYEEIPNSDPRISDPLSFMQAREGEQVILIDYGKKHQDFWNKVHEICPPPVAAFASRDPENLDTGKNGEPISEGRI